MDVVTLPSENDNDPPVCIVADDLLRMVDGKSKQGTIYCVFTKDVILTEPFKLFHFAAKRKVTRLNGTFAKERSFSLWDETGRERRPNRRRYAGDYIKLNFFQSKGGRNDGIICVWTDFIEQANGQNPGPSKPQHIRSSSKPGMNLYLLLPLQEESVQVLSEKAFGSYNLMLQNNQIVKRNTAECYIVQNCDTAKILFENCGHVVCEKCWFENSKRIGRDCGLCRDRQVMPAEEIRLKLRHGPCPIDMCVPHTETYGAILVPCGCRIYCQQLENASRDKEKLDRLLKIIPSCPYDACKKIVSNILPVRA